MASVHLQLRTSSPDKGFAQSMPSAENHLQGMRTGWQSPEQPPKCQQESEWTNQNGIGYPQGAQLVQKRKQRPEEGTAVGGPSALCQLCWHFVGSTAAATGPTTSSACNEWGQGAIPRHLQVHRAPMTLSRHPRVLLPQAPWRALLR